MSKSRKEIKHEALSCLSGKWVEYILVGILGWFILYFAMVFGLLLFIVPGLLVASLGTFVSYHLSLTVLDGRKPNVDDLFAFKDKVSSIFGGFMLQVLITLVAMIPYFAFVILLEQGHSGIGVILLGIFSFLFLVYITLRYAYLYYILRDTKMGAIAALKEAARLTKGNKWRMIVFALSFIGWQLLSLLTFNLLLIWLIPYMNVANANLYRTIASEKNLLIQLPDYEPEEDLTKLTDY